MSTELISRFIIWRKLADKVLVTLTHFQAHSEFFLKKKSYMVDPIMVLLEFT